MKWKLNEIIKNRTRPFYVLRVTVDPRLGQFCISGLSDFIYIQFTVVCDKRNKGGSNIKWHICIDRDFKISVCEFLHEKKTHTHEK